MKPLYRIDRSLVIVVSSGEFDKSVKRFVENTQPYVSECVSRRFFIPEKTRKARKRFGSVLESKRYKTNSQDGKGE